MLKSNVIPVDSKYFLSDRMTKIILAPTPGLGFNANPEVDRNIANSLLSSMHKMHRAGVDNYVWDLIPIEEGDDHN